MPRKDLWAYDLGMRYLAVITMMILAWAIVQPVAAQSFKPDVDAGFKAYEQKDFATALRHFRPLAKQGNVYAQWRLGWMYHHGDGVWQDLVMANVWYNVARANNTKFIRHDRDRVLAILDGAERKLGRKLSKRCFKKPAKCPEYSDD